MLSDAADKPVESSTGGEARDRGSGRQKRPTTLVRYGAMNWLGEFTYKPGELRCGAIPVVVQTERGIELGEQSAFCPAGCPNAVSPEQVRAYVEASGPEFCRPNAGTVLRVASPQDIDEHRRLNAHVKEDIAQCAALAAEFNLDMKVITAEHLLGGERIVFYFRSEGRVDFRNLVKELARRYHTRIEMRQVGARDEARLVADYEVCGRECCCKVFLKKLRPVSMKMAKLQKSTLDPSKVSGRCGRLRCCLRYEHEGYQELAARLPRRNTRVRVAGEEATVLDTQILTQLVLLRYDDLREVAVGVEEIEVFDLPRSKPTPPPPAEEPVEEAGREGARRSRRRRKKKPAEGQAGAAEAPAVPEPTRAQPERPPEPSDDTKAEAKPSRRRGGRRRRRRRPGSGPPTRNDQG